MRLNRSMAPEIAPFKAIDEFNSIALVYDGCRSSLAVPRWRPKTDCAQDRRLFGGMCSMGISDPENRKKLSDARWLPFKHQAERQSWPWWKRLVHHFEPCPICKPDKVKTQ
jgi:hypothetical protein